MSGEEPGGEASEAPRGDTEASRLGRRLASPEVIRALFSGGHIEEGQAEALLGALGRPLGLPDQALLLSAVAASAGVALVLAGVIYFVAFNWAELGPWTKLGLAQGALIGAALGAHLLRDKSAGRVLLVAACVLVGALLAVYGQVYQTGADVFELFFAWALLIAPWVLASRSPVAWVIELVLLNVGLGLYWDQVGQEQWGLRGANSLLAHALLNGLAWVAWEIAARRGGEWLRARWPVRLFATVALGSLSLYLAGLILEELRGTPGPLALFGFVLWAVALASLASLYRRRTPDLFMLALGVGSLMIVLSTGVGYFLFEGLDAEVAGVFMLGFFVVAEVGVAAYVLREAAKEMREAEGAR